MMRAGRSSWHAEQIHQPVWASAAVKRGTCIVSGAGRPWGSAWEEVVAVAHGGHVRGHGMPRRRHHAPPVHAHPARGDHRNPPLHRPRECCVSVTIVTTSALYCRLNHMYGECEDRERQMCAHLRGLSACRHHDVGLPLWHASQSHAWRPRLESSRKRGGPCGRPRGNPSTGHHWHSACTAQHDENLSPPGGGFAPSDDHPAMPSTWTHTTGNGRLLSEAYQHCACTPSLTPMSKVKRCMYHDFANNPKV